jgi:hypothetical protein
MPTEANSLNAKTVGIVGNTGTAFTGTAATQYNILSGGTSTSILNNIAPSSTSGIPLVSNGSSSQPSFTTALVPGGGTGSTSFTAYAPICGGTTTTGSLQSAATGLSTSGFALISNGSSTLPSFQSVSAAGATTTFDGDSGATTPTSGGVILISGGATGLTTTAATSAVELTGILNVGSGGTGLITTTAYGIITGGTTATGNFQNAGTGTSGQYYKSGGASALGTWTSTSSIGNLVLIQSQTASSSSTLTFTTGITATYNNYMVVISNYKASTSQNLLLQISTNGGSSYISSGYSGGVNQSVWNSATLLNSNLTVGFLLGFSVTTTQPTNGVVYLQNFTSGAGYPMCQGQLTGVFNSNFGTCILSSLYDTASTTVNAFQIGPSTGTLSTGTFTLYGILE